MITWLAENSDDEHLKRMKQNAEHHAVKMEVASRSPHDESALFDDDNDEDEIVLGREEQPLETSKQRLLSKEKLKPEFEGLRVTSAGHKVQDIRELMSVPVCLFFPFGSSALELTSVIGYHHCRSRKESPCYQSLQREPICQQSRLNTSFNTPPQGNLFLCVNPSMLPFRRYPGFALRFMPFFSRPVTLHLSYFVLACDCGRKATERLCLCVVVIQSGQFVPRGDV